MKWLTLKIYNNTALFKEYEQVQTLYYHLQSSIKMSKTKKAVNDFNILKEEIKQRIGELNDFYSKHINDSRIGAFENIKNKLEALLASKTPKMTKQSQVKQNQNSNQKIGHSKSQSSLKRSNSSKKSNVVGLEENYDEENDIEIFTCCNQLLASQVKNLSQWKDVFLQIKLSEAEYNLFLKDSNAEV